MDIEVYPNCFLAGVKDLDSKEGRIFEISKYKNDLQECISFFNNFKSYMITFNGIHYDQPVLAYICQDLNGSKDNAITLTEKIHDFSSTVINADRIDSRYKYYFKWTPIDLYMYWSRMLRLSKKISLKGLGIQINYPVVQELPYEPGTYLTKEQIEEVKVYNYKHDLGIMEKLIDHPVMWQGKPTTFRKQIQLRGNIHKEYNLNKFIYSWDAPKIASELLLSFYAKSQNMSSWELKKQQEGYIGKGRLPLEDPKFKLPIFQKLFKDMSVATRDFHQDIIFLHKNTSLKISYGIGGVK